MSEELQNQKLNGKACEEDGEFEEEEILVHVEFDCEVDQSTFNPETTFKLIGIDSENPLMQLGNKVFKGDWKDVVGTSVFFEEDEETKSKLADADPLFNRKPANPLKLACCTRKSLVMSRVFVKPKSNKSEATENSTLNNSENKSLSTEVEQPTITNKPVTRVENDEQMEVS